MDWSKLSFNYTKTNTIVYSHYKDGKWSSLQSSADFNISMHALSGCLHYGLECFEGLKAFNGVDGKIRIFRPDMNAQRLIRSADFLGITPPPQSLFIEAVMRAVEENKDFIPPYSTRSSLYIRPLLIGTGAQLGLKTSLECMFVVIVNPVGSYSGETLVPVDAVISRKFDRAAPNGSGAYKVGGNYASAMYAGIMSKKAGYNSTLFLDAKEHKYIEEFSSSNFFGFKGNCYITPQSNSILPSITNNSLELLANKLGFKVERRPILMSELESFNEVGECGTAVVITPVWRIDDKKDFDAPIDKSYEFIFKDDNNILQCGPNSRLLYDTLTGIQYGEITDENGWIYSLK